jgi:hypothetical protein
METFFFCLFVKTRNMSNFLRDFGRERIRIIFYSFVKNFLLAEKNQFSILQ